MITTDDIVRWTDDGIRWTDDSQNTQLQEQSCKFAVVMDHDRWVQDVTVEWENGREDKDASSKVGQASELVHRVVLNFLHGSD